MILTASRDKTIIVWTLTRDEVGHPPVLLVLRRAIGSGQTLSRWQSKERSGGRQRGLSGRLSWDAGGSYVHSGQDWMQDSST